MNIYEIDREILACIDQESGEIIDFEKLNELQMERDRKVENIACWIIDLENTAEGIKKQEGILKARRESAEKHAERLREYLAEVLQGEKFKSDRVTVGYRRSVAVEIAEETQLPEKFLTVRTTFTPNKVAIKDAIRLGEDVPGCSLVTRSSLFVK